MDTEKNFEEIIKTIIDNKVRRDNLIKLYYSLTEEQKKLMYDGAIIIYESRYNKEVIKKILAPFVVEI